MATAALQCGLPRVSWCDARSIALCYDCCISQDAELVVADVCLPQGTIVWLDEAAVPPVWKPLAAAIPGAAVRLGVMQFAVDTTLCDPAVPGKGVIITADALVAGYLMIWPSAPAISAPDKKTITDRLRAVGIKITTQSA